jgi:hypothetical protein
MNFLHNVSRGRALPVRNATAATKCLARARVPLAVLLAAAELLVSAAASR